MFEDTVSQFDDAPLPIKPESGASEHALDRAPPEGESITEIIVPGRVKRKDREAEGRRVYNARQMQRLLRKYGWERGHDGNHPTFVSPEGAKVSVPIHGGSHTIAKGTANAIVSQITNRDRTQYLIEKIEKRIQGNFKK